MTTVLESKPSLDTHPLILPSNIDSWKKATKTKTVKAKHMQTLLCDDSMLTKLLLQTLEGQQMLKGGSMVCLGAIDEPWQQTPEKLLKQYAVTGIDANGWLICTPKPENQRDVYITDKELESFEARDLQADSPVCGFSIYGQWGERQADGRFLQFGKFGDVIARNQDDPSDVWIIARKLYDATYETIKMFDPSSEDL